MALLATCAAACAPGCTESRRVATELPGFGSLTMLACSETEAWIGTGVSTKRFVAGEPNALLVRIGRDGTSSARELPGTFVSTFQPTAGDGGWAVTVDVDDLEVVGSRLLAIRSGDDVKVPVPSGTFGGAFHTPSAGFVWGSARVHWTKDGGRTWVRKRIEPGEIRRGPDTGPQLAGTGDLWVPVRVADDGVLLIQRLDGALRTAAAWKDEQIEGVRLSQEGTSYVVLRPAAASGFRVVAIPAAGGDAREVYRRPTGSVMEFAVSGSRLALLVVDGGPPASFFGAWPQALHVSVDGGRTWTVTDVTSARIESICAVPSGIWASSVQGRDVSLLRW